METIEGPFDRREMIFAEYLNSFLRDALAILGGVGLPLTALGVWLAYWQLRKTASAADAASKAAVSAFNDSRREYNRYVIAQSLRLLTEARLHVNYEAWKAAGMRLNDMAQLLLGVAGHEWPGFASRLLEMEKYFERLDRREIKFTKGQREKWDKLERELSTRIAESFGPFPNDEAESDNANTRQIQDDS